VIGVQWLKIFDASGSWPKDPAACWADGFRVIAGYAGSQSWKTFTPAMLARWVTPEHPFAIAAMYEGSGREPFLSNSADYGTQHALAARKAWRAMGMPDNAAIAYAVDTDATMAQVRGPIATYFRAVAAHDTCKPISYLENDGSEWLAINGITAGGFIPAAYGWGNPAVLMTPDNALPHAIWLQEHNGVQLHGGDVDTGHIRDDAPIWWADKTGGTDMPLIAADADVVWAHKVPNMADRSAPDVSTQTALSQIWGTLVATAKTESAQSAQIVALTAAVKALAVGGGTVDTTALLAGIDTAVAKHTDAVLARLAAAEKASSDALAAAS
jgi:hypothetical protein